LNEFLQDETGIIFRDFLITKSLQAEKPTQHKQHIYMPKVKKSDRDSHSRLVEYLKEEYLEFVVDKELTQVIRQGIMRGDCEADEACSETGFVDEYVRACRKLSLATLIILRASCEYYQSAPIKTVNIKNVDAFEELVDTLSTEDMEEIHYEMDMECSYEVNRKGRVVKKSSTNKTE
jgi:hypothetical protein